MTREEALAAHRRWHGKIEVTSRCEVASLSDLALAYTPGVAEPCKEIAQNVDLVYDYTRRFNMVAVVTDGSAVLGLGDIGPEAGLPVMEGKAVLFKQFGGVDAVPILIGTQDVDEIVRTVELISPGFGGINLEDISAPRCFEIERKLKERLDIPVFHDDQHGTAIVVLAAVQNALRIVNKAPGELRVVINGAGAAGIACARLLLMYGVSDIVLCNRKGILCMSSGLDAEREAICRLTNPRGLTGSLSDAMRDSDVFLGLSAPRTVTKEMVASMRKDPIVFAMANPVPEIMPDEAKAGGARIVGTGRSDFPNQINNVLAFPGVFRGALDVRARDINDSMKLAAASAIASLVSTGELCEEYLLPPAFHSDICGAVGGAVAEAAVAAGLSRRRLPT